MALGQTFLVAQSARRSAASAPEPLAIVRDEEVAKGQVVSFDYPGANDPCLLVRLEDGRLVAFGQKCTHLSCAVIPEPKAGRFLCPCHNGSFDLASGLPLAGPPRRPLPQIRLEVRDGVVYAVAVELRT